MNSMTEAFIAAGVRPPTIKERLWRVIKEEQGLTQRELVKRLPAIPAGSISSQLHDLEQAGLIYAKGAKGFGPTGSAKAYYTDEVQFRRVPAPKKPKAPARPQGTTHTPPPPPPGQTDKPVEVSPNIDHLTLGQARALYLQLKKLFG